jgi:hypothetical protein
MPTDETRRLLKIFGVAVTELEDAVHKKSSPEEIGAAEKEANVRLDEITALVNRLRADASSLMR